MGGARRGALLGSAIGLAVGVAIMYAAWDHNAQGEIHSKTEVNWGYWLLIGASWFVPVAVSLSLFLGSLLALASRLRGRGAGQQGLAADTSQLGVLGPGSLLECNSVASARLVSAGWRS